MKHLFIISALFIGASNLFAQASYSVSNNPNATLEMYEENKQEKIIEITQDRNLITYKPISTKTVLKNFETGIGYKMVDHKVSYNAKTGVEKSELKFKVIDTDIEQFTLLDPLYQANSIYFVDIKMLDK